MSTYLIAISLIFAILLAGIGIDRVYRAFAAKNPQLGPFRKSGGGCDCGTGHCRSTGRASCDR